ncbi:hypothetical protein FJ428_28335 [Mesorhizobium sp. B2-8-1]|nr:hypothetical protein FJ428_28335 [Mesorhizobium sp. B2-8-1]
MLRRASSGGKLIKAGTLRGPPLSCRTSPPQGGRLAVSAIPPCQQVQFTSLPAPSTDKALPVLPSVSSHRD